MIAAMQKEVEITMRHRLQEYSLEHVRERLIHKDILAADIVDEAIEEYKHYMTLILLGYKPLDMFSQQVDDVWHNHILFTKDYANFCQQVFGYFLHHNPKTPKEKKEGMQNHAKQFFIQAYTTVFHITPPLIWGNKSTPNDCCGNGRGGSGGNSSCDGGGCGGGDCSAGSCS